MTQHSVKIGSEPPCGGAERTRDSRLFECRLSPLTFCRLAPAAKGRFPPFPHLKLPIFEFYESCKTDLDDFMEVHRSSFRRKNDQLAGNTVILGV
jgi:hypothetical protein